LLKAGNNWNVNQYEDCSGGGPGAGRLINAESSGYDSSGNLICFATAYPTGNWHAGTSSCAGATQHLARVRRNFLVDCETGFVGWTTQHHCLVNLGSRLLAPNDTTCAVRAFRAFAQGT
jgi:hypothetical protein